MSPRSIEEIVADFYTCIQQACQTGTLNPAKLHFSDDIVFEGPNGRVEGKSQVLKMIQEVVSNLSKISIQRQFFDKGASCTIFEAAIKNPHALIPAAEWLNVKNGVIYEIRAFYDSAKWQRLRKSA
jgi:hypothetical protein